jgi:predicted RNase H-like HicB family nuclease
MQHLVVIQPHNGGYRATALGLPDCHSEGITEEEALANIRRVISETLQRIKIVAVDIPEPAPSDPWVQIVGMYANEPDFEEFQKELQAHRRELAEP